MAMKISLDVLKLARQTVVICGMAAILGACSFVLSEDEEYRFRTIDYPVGEKQKTE